MKYLFLSNEGRILSTAFRVKDEGNDVKVWIRKQRFKSEWDGLLNKVEHWGEALEPDRVIVFDSPGGGKTADRLKKQDYLVLGAGEIHDKIKLDNGKKDDSFVGINISLEGWFNGHSFAHPFLFSFIEDEFLTGNLGPTIGHAGNVTFALLNEKLTEGALSGIEGELKEHSYHGPISIQANIDLVEPIYFYNSIFTPHFNFDVFQTIQEGLTKDIGELLYETVSGRLSKFPIEQNKFFIGVRVGIPPWPFSDRGVPEGMEIAGLNEEDRKHIHFYGMKLINSSPVTTGTRGEVLVATDKGDTIKEASVNVYERLVRLNLPEKEYRVDIGWRAQKDYDLLKGKGLL